MPVSLLRAALGAVLVASVASAGCDRTSDPLTPTAPAAVEITEPQFIGTLTVNGGAVQSFAVTNVGTITVTIADLQPNRADASLSIGLELGTWNGTSCGVTGLPTLANYNAGVGSGIAGFANGIGTFCVRVLDVGQLTEPVTFTITIKHY
jgi:hypothetical protein